MIKLRALFPHLLVKENTIITFKLTYARYEFSIKTVINFTYVQNGASNRS